MMIGHGVDADGSTLVVFGLTPSNLDLLQRGNPINIPAGNDGLKGAGLDHVRVVIMFGETLEALQAAIATGPETKIFDHRRKPL